jgi:hypothetical protein
MSDLENATEKPHDDDILSILRELEDNVEDDPVPGPEAISIPGKEVYVFMECKDGEDWVQIVWEVEKDDSIPRPDGRSFMLDDAGKELLLGALPGKRIVCWDKHARMGFAKALGGFPNGVTARDAKRHLRSSFGLTEGSPEDLAATLDAALRRHRQDIALIESLYPGYGKAIALRGLDIALGREAMRVSEGKSIDSLMLDGFEPIQPVDIFEQLDRASGPSAESNPPGVSDSREDGSGGSSRVADAHDEDGALPGAIAIPSNAFYAAAVLKDGRWSIQLAWEIEKNGAMRPEGMEVVVSDETRGPLIEAMAGKRMMCWDRGERMLALAALGRIPQGLRAYDVRQFFLGMFGIARGSPQAAMMTFEAACSRHGIAPDKMDIIQKWHGRAIALRCLESAWSREFCALCDGKTIPPLELEGFDPIPAANPAR